MKKANKDVRYGFRADKDFQEKIEKAFEAHKATHTGKERVSISNFIRGIVAKKIGIK